MAATRKVTRRGGDSGKPSAEVSITSLLNACPQQMAITRDWCVYYPVLCPRKPAVERWEPSLNLPMATEGGLVCLQKSCWALSKPQ